MTDPHSALITELVGVYNANGSLRGELAYLVGRLRGTAHCGLCDITHGRVRERENWKRCRQELPVPFATYHLDDQPNDAAPFTRVEAPVVLARTASGLTRLLGPAELDACASSPERLLTAIRDAASAAGLRWRAEQ